MKFHSSKVRKQKYDTADNVVVDKWSRINSELVFYKVLSSTLGSFPPKFCACVLIQLILTIRIWCIFYDYTIMLFSPSASDRNLDSSRSVILHALKEEQNEQQARNKSLCFDITLA